MSIVSILTDERTTNLRRIFEGIFKGPVVIFVLKVVRAASLFGAFVISRLYACLSCYS